MKNKQKMVEPAAEVQEFEGVEPGPAMAPYGIVWCPVRHEARATLLCMSCCADASWATSKIRETRAGCSRWPLVRDYHEGLIVDADEEEK